MNNPNQAEKDFLEKLLNQEPVMTTEEYQSYRRELDQKFARVERDEQRSRHLVGIAIIVFVLGNGGIFALNLAYTTAMPEPVLTMLAGFFLLSPVFCLILVGIYLFKYRLRLRRMRDQAHEVTLRDLQRQILELREKLAAAEGRAGEKV